MLIPLLVLARIVNEHQYVQSLSHMRLLLEVFCTSFSYAVMTLYALVAMASIGRKRPWQRGAGRTAV